MTKHVCRNSFHGEGANGGCYFEIEPGESEGTARLDVGWSCVVVHRKEMPITWLSEIIAIATGHRGGVAGFLAEHRYGGDSYALMCDPPRTHVSDIHEKLCEDEGCPQHGTEHVCIARVEPPCGGQIGSKWDGNL